MTIGTTAPRAIFNCNGVTTVFPVPIQSYLAADFAAILTAPVSAGGAQTLLTLNSNYTLVTSSSDAPPKWTLTTQTAGGITSPYPTGYTLQVFLNPVENQQTQYIQGQQFPSLAVQANFDRLTQMVQRLTDQFGRAIGAPDGDVSPQMALPAANIRALQYLGFDGNGNAIAVAALPGPQLTQPVFNSLLVGAPPYVATAAETNAGVVGSIINYGKWPSPWKDVSRYVSDNTGGTDVAAQFSAAIAAESHVIIPDGIYRFKSQVNVNKSNITIEGTGRAGPSSQGRAGKGAYIILDSAAGAGAAAFFWGNNPYVGIDIRNLGINMPTAGFGLIGIRFGQVLYWNIDNIWCQGTGTTSDDQIGVQLDGLLPGGGFGYTGAGNIDRSLFANLLTGVNMIDDPTNGVIDGINIRGNSFQGSANHTSNRGLAYGRKAFACTFENNTVLGQWIGVDTLGTGLRQENNYYENDFPPAGVLAWRWVRGTGNTYIQNTALGEWRNALSYQAPNNGVDGCTIQTQNNLLFDNTFCETALGFREFGRNFNAGRYTTPAFAAGNFTSNAGTWVVAGQTTYEYTIVGKKMTVAFFIVGTATGAGTELRIAIPQQTVYGSPVAVLSAQRTRNPIHVFQNATGAFGVAEVQVGDTFIRCFKDASAGGGSWTNGDCEVYGEITFEIQ